ncbi:TPA: hypothetical protein I7676_15680 [Vibrio vulnificus]|uniref:hypothetical protein n=1 Tax=Vibrio vulnificus TaxID=672 RepID=UPI001A2CB917|nr:hypothetical protein [Vibrio vulnificus]MCA3883095.1 hypothetical protein [Vibrio vulnificus]MCA3949395.1 hypothetical protein [Vibrio vulnificus]HAS8137087.1 hypothetical protein [Vibrio vulnificus]HAS8217765.1 hypothetical protein [Vibrio vulnificus]HAS8298638.1 hypothetical protein [Vibrio vulnificus]
MIVTIKKNRNFIPTELKNNVTDIITTTLNSIKTTENAFVINDQLCYREQRGGKITTCVMNSATYISSAFQKNLATHNDCQGETVIQGQAFDGFISHPFLGTGYRIKNKDDILKVVHRYIDDNSLSPESVYTLFPMFYGMYVNRGYYDLDGIPKDVHHLFEAAEFNCDFKVGVEFETGNVASSFRAINKLYVLFQKGEIDAGVFVTSIDKPNCATRIWPVANRNGSFQELEKRNYEEQISLPLICIGFAPDRFDRAAPFLGKNGTLYHPKKQNKPHPSGIYDIYTGESNEEILIPK